jgi:poly(A) polymerase
VKHELNHPIFSVVSHLADEMQMPAYVIGGYVRDVIMGRLSKDIDIVVIGNGIEMATRVAEKAGKVKVSVFKNFGTAMLHYGDSDIEFVGARKESYDFNSRKPTVENGTLQDDQQRRDFTINTLAFSLNKENFGELLDPFDGIKDIENKIIRTPLASSETFSDDPLRMMRAIRFAAQLNFIIEENTFKAITENRKRIHIVSKERIIDELNKILLSDKPSFGINLLEQSGLLELIFPQLAALKGVEIIADKGHKDNFKHTLEVLDKISINSQNLWLRWAALLHDIAKPQTKKFDPKEGWTFHGHEFLGSKMVKRIFNELKLPLNEKMKYVEKLVLLHLRPIVLSEEIVSDSAIRRLLFEAGDDIDDLMLLAEADITSKNPEKVKKFLAKFSLVRQKLIDIEEKDKLRNWQPPISGEEIMKTFGLTPCREIGIIKNSIREAILEGVIENNYESAYQYMLNVGKKLHLTSQTKKNS